MLDAACAAAVDLAREVAQEASDGHLGEHVDVVAEADRVATHRFTCTRRGYAGWHWAVTVARASRGKRVTVDEVALLPGPDALLPPPWVPWAERVEAGDLGVGGLLPTGEDEPALLPTYASLGLDGPLGAWEAEPGLVDELGLRRARVLSPEGRDEAADRWWSGGGGPAAPIARAAPATCDSCGWAVPLTGALGQAFAVCANRMAPDDGRVVSADHGCGGHSEASVARRRAPLPEPVVDDTTEDPLDLTEDGDEPPAPDDAPPGDEAPEVDETLPGDEAPRGDDALPGDEAS